MIRATPSWRPLAALAGFVLVPALGLTAATAVAAPSGEHIDLYQDGVAVTTGPDGGPAVLRLAPGVGATYLEGSRVLDPAALDAGALAAGVDPAGGEAGRLDLRARTLDDGAALAAPAPKWRYVWPRDASFTAAAFARTGHVDDARDVLGFLARVQEDDGSFHARYLPDGSGVPADRGLQSDGVGWVLWAAAVVLEEPPAAARPAATAANDSRAASGSSRWSPPGRPRSPSPSRTC